MELLWWFAAIVVMAIGLIGTVLPVVPGTTIILAAAVAASRDGRTGERNELVGARGIWWRSLLVSYTLEFASSYFGAKYFGATKWGVLGAVIGGIIGLFTGFVTLLVLPIVGAITGELIAGKQLVDAGKAGLGRVAGQSRRHDRQTGDRPGNDRRFPDEHAGRPAAEWRILFENLFASP